MLIEFSVKNYLCFKDWVTLSMVASPDKEHEEHTFDPETFPERLLKSCVIYGANASGKSNLFKAMSFMRRFVVSSSKDRQVKEKTGVTPFRLSTATEGEPSEFEISFICEGIKYRYGFALDREKVHSEWLFHVPVTREANLFERKGNKFKISGRFREGKGLKDKTRDNALFLSVAAQFNGEISTKILKWFYNFNAISGLQGYTPVTFKMMDTGYSEKIGKFIKIADLGIEGLSKRILKPSEIDQDFLEFLKVKIDGFDEELTEVEMKIPEIQYHHKKFDDENTQVSIEKFSSNNESEGTQRLFSLAGPIIDTLEEGNILVVDELDCSLHFLIILEILRMFHSKHNKCAQLIFNCHNTNLLSNKLFRRDQIYFIEKDCFGSSDLYSLYDFKDGDEKVRKDSSFAKNYVTGKFGAVPHTGDFEELLLSQKGFDNGTERIEEDKNI
ncbi:MAG: ATP-binding protein [Candidatus Eremiobacteraeota bacterium]|nr:ATP-binding protein [Candidatus Eremiobacteraeota bacterium]